MISVSGVVITPRARVKTWQDHYMDQTANIKRNTSAAADNNQANNLSSLSWGQLDDEVANLTERLCDAISAREHRNLLDVVEVQDECMLDMGCEIRALKQHSQDLYNSTDDVADQLREAKQLIHEHEQRISDLNYEIADLTEQLDDMRCANYALRSRRSSMTAIDGELPARPIRL